MEKQNQKNNEKENKSGIYFYQDLVTGEIKLISLVGQNGEILRRFKNDQ